MRIVYNCHWRDAAHEGEFIYIGSPDRADGSELLVEKGICRDGLANWLVDRKALLMMECAGFQGLAIDGQLQRPDCEGCLYSEGELANTEQRIVGASAQKPAIDGNNVRI